MKHSASNSYSNFEAWSYFTPVRVSPQIVMEIGGTLEMRGEDFTGRIKFKHY